MCSPFKIKGAMLLASLLLNACSGPDKARNQSDEMNGPILGMVMAASLDQKGRAVGATFRFAPGAPQMTAIFRIGKIAGSNLKVAWYKASESGDEKLFEHQIPVKADQTAFSVAKNGGQGLAGGRYKVIASLDGQQREMESDVASGQGGPATVATHAQGQPPVAGTSGTAVPQPPSPPEKKPSCSVQFKGEWQDDSDPNLVDPTANDVSEMVQTECEKQETAIFPVRATANGRVSLVGWHYGGSDEIVFPFDPCSADVDLPGTKIVFTARVEDRNDVPDAKQTITLGEDTLAPSITLISDPAAGAKLKAGAKIILKAKATEQRRDGPWQTGVKVIQITADGGDSIGPSWSNSSNLPKSCGRKTWEQTYEATYTVAKDPPVMVRICAIAEDYVGNIGSSCAKYFTVSHWGGTDEWINVLETTEQPNAKIAYTVKSDARLFVRFLFWPTKSPDRSGRVELKGEAHAEWRSRSEEVAGPCAGSSTATPELVSWNAVLSGTAWLSEHSDGSLDAKVHLEATPSRTEYMSTRILRGYCQKSGTGVDDVKATTPSIWGGGRLDVTLANGSLTTHTPLPLNAGQTGSSYHELKIFEIKPPQ